MDSLYVSCQHDDGYIDGRSRIEIHTDKRTQVHSAQSSLTVTHPSTNRGRRCLTSAELALVATVSFIYVEEIYLHFELIAFTDWFDGPV